MRNPGRPRNDDQDMRATSNSWSDRQVEALLAGRGEPSDADLLNVLQGLRQIAAAPAPEPSSALAAVLSGASPLPASGAAVPQLPQPSRPHPWRRGRTGAVALVAAFGLTTAGAAANALPAPAQRAAARVLNTVTPFHFPAPADHARPLAPTPGPSATPSPKQPPSPHPTATAHDDQDHSPQQGTKPPRDHRGGSQDPQTDEATTAPEPSDKQSHADDTETSTGSAPALRPVHGQPPPHQEDAPGAQPSSDPSNSNSDAANAPIPTSTRTASGSSDGTPDASAAQ